MIPVGRHAEDLAAQYLTKNGYKLLDRNFRTKSGEIDIICEKSGKIIFVEVKSRIGQTGSKPYEAVRLRKLQHFKKAVFYYLKKNKSFDKKLRFDVISVILYTDRSLQSLQHYENVDFSDVVF